MHRGVWKRVIVWLMVLSIFVSSSGLEAFASNIIPEEGIQVTNEDVDVSDEDIDVLDEGGEDENATEDDTDSDVNQQEDIDTTISENSVPEIETEENEGEITEEEIEVDVVEENQEALVPEISVSANAVKETQSETAELDYILGRPMTEEEIAYQESLVPQLPSIEPMKLDTDDLYAGMGISLFFELPEAYDSRTQGIITPVKNQNPYGTCWAFATCAVMESAMKRDELTTEDIDLSERHLAYFARNTGYDALDNANGDTITSMYPTQHLEGGGNLYDSAIRLMNWQGIAEEEDYRYSEATVAIERENAQDIVGTVKDFYFIPTKGASVSDKKTVIKNMLRQYGAVFWSYYHDDQFYAPSTGAYYMDLNVGTNHAITIVGWDDNYSKDNFIATSAKPNNDGAWIVKNSWGTNWGKSGYFYISYEDASLGEGNDAGVMIAGSTEEYDNNYFYGNTSYFNYWNNRKKVAQVYEAKSGAETEIINAVSFMLASSGESYQIQVYKNPNMVDGVVKNPETGTPMYDTPVEGITGYAGLYTVEIPEIAVQKGERFAIVITFTDENGAAVFMDGKQEGYYDSEVNALEGTNNEIAYGQSLYGASGYWYDMADQGNFSFRINVLTTNGGNVPVLSCESSQPASFADVKENKVNWSKCADAISYEVYRAESQEGTYSKIGEVSGDVYSYTDNLASEYWNRSCYYKVIAQFGDGTQTESSAIKVSNNISLKVKGVYVETTGNDNVVQWKSIDGASGYEVERKKGTEGTYEKIADVSGGASTSYTDLNAASEDYYYRVRAYKDNVYSQWSDPAAVDNVKISQIINSNGLLRFRADWQLCEGAAYYEMRVTYNISDGTRTLVYRDITNTPITFDPAQYSFKDSDGVVYGNIGEEFMFSVTPYDVNGTVIMPNPYKAAKIVWTPLEVSKVTHTYNSGIATYTWSGASNAQFIDIYKSTDPDSHGNEVWKSITVGDANNFTDTDLERGEVVYYWLYSGVTNLAGEKVYSNAFKYKMEVPEQTKVVVKAISVNGETVEELPEELYLNDVILLKAHLTPENADLGDVQWSCEDASIVNLVDHKDGTATATIVKAGNTTVMVTAGEDSVPGTIELSAILKTAVIREVKALDSNNLQISWDAVYENETYNVYRKAASEAEYSVIASNISQTTYIDNAVETGETYSYKIQLLKDGVTSSLDTTEAKEGKILPEPIEVLKKTYHSLVIKNDPICEYAISTVNSKEGLEFVSDTTKSEIVFDNLEELQTYYVFARVKKHPGVYADTLQVTIPEKGILRLSSGKITLVKNQTYNINYTVTTGDGENEELIWTAWDNSQQKLMTEMADGSTVIYGSDNKEIARLVGNTLIATGNSQTKAFSLTGKNSFDLEGSCEVSISVPVTELTVTDMKINGNEVEDISLLNLQDVLQLQITTEPENADPCTLTWKTSNEKVVQIVTTSEDGKNVTLQAVEKGVCRITVTSGNGLEKSWRIYVYDADEVLEYWLVGENETLTIDQVLSGLTEEKDYILSEFTPHGITLSLEEGNQAEQTLKVYGLKRQVGELPTNPTTAGELFKLEIVSADNVTFVSANPSVAKVTAEGKVVAVNKGETDIYVYGNSANEKFGSYHVIVTGEAAGTEEECPIDSNVRLYPVKAKMWLEQFRHYAKDRVALKIKDRDGNVYPAEHFIFTSEDSKVCMVDEEGVVRANPSYLGDRDKTVEITAKVKNDPKGRKVTFEVSLYGNQQVAELDIAYNNENPDVVTKKFEKNETFTVYATAWGSNGEEILNPDLKWSASNSRVAAVKINRDGSATVTMKRAGQGNVLCTANDYKKAKDSLLVRAVDVTPVLSRTVLKVETKKLSRTIGGKNYKMSPSFTVNGGYGITYGEPIITSAMTGKNKLDVSQLLLVKNPDNSYSIAVEEAYVRQFGNNTRMKVTMSLDIADVPADVDITKTDCGITLQVMTSEPSIRLSEAGTINRYYSAGEKTRSLLTVKTTSKVEKIEIARNGQGDDFNQYFEIVKENGNWYLELKNASKYTKDSAKGKLLISLEGYEAIEKDITVRTKGKKPVITQQEIPMIFVNDSYGNKTADVTLLNQQAKMTLLTAEATELANSEIIGADKKVAGVTFGNGKVQITLNEKATFREGEVISIPMNIWEVDVEGNKVWYTPQTLEVKVQVSTKAPSLSVKNRTVTINNQVLGEAGTTKLYPSHQNMKINAAGEWTVKEYDSASKAYNKDVEWLTFTYNQNSQILNVRLKEAHATGSYKIRVSNVLEGFKDVTFDITVKIVSKQPLVTIKSSGRLDLTNKEGCSVVGKVSFKNTVSDKMVAVDILDDARFEAELISGNSFALRVTEQGMGEDSIPYENISLKVKVTLEGGTTLEGVLQIRPIQTKPKLKAVETKQLRKCFQEHEIKYDLNQYLVRGAKIKEIEVIKAPAQLNVETEGGMVQVSLKDNGVKSRKYVIKLKVTFVGLFNNTQYISLTVNVME